MTVCLNCGEEIQLKRKDSIFCSNSCGGKWRNRKYYGNNQDTVRRNRELQNSKTESRILSRIKSRAKRNNLPFNLEVCDIEIPKFCPVLGLELVLSNQGSGYHPDSPSVDKINPKLGYIKGNVRVISARANLLKNDATPKELRLVLLDLERLHNENPSLGL